MDSTSLRVKITLCILIACFFVGMGQGAIAPGETPETQGIVTTTSMSCAGQINEIDQLAWRLSNEFLDTNQFLEVIPPEEPPQEQDGYAKVDTNAEKFVNSPEPPLNFLGEIQMSTSYSESTLAVNGFTSYTKEMNIDTAGKNRDSENVNAEKSVQFVSDSSVSGSISSDESITTDLVGENVNKLKSTLCPFAPPTPICWPPFCEIANAGSDLLMTQVSFTTMAQSRTVVPGDNFQDTPIPSIADIPPDLHYSINVEGFGPSEPASGTVETLFRIHTMDGRATPIEGLSSDLKYRDDTTASGLINGFKKSLDYESGIRRL